MIRSILESFGRRPTGLPEGIIPTDNQGFSNSELSVKLAEEGKPFIVGGISLVDPGMAISYVVGIHQWKLPEGMTFDEIKEKSDTDGLRIDIKGWNYHYGGVRQGSGKYRYLDTLRGIETVLAIPNTMIYFIAEVESEFVEQTADQKKLKRIVEYTLKQIHD